MIEDGIKISELNTTSTINNEDLIPIVQNNETKSISFGNINKYSTTETIIGTWIDGKPIYKKTILFNNINIGTSDYSWTGSLNLSNISYITLDETHSYFVITGQKYPINYSQPQYNSGSSYIIKVTNYEPDFIFYKTNNFSVSDIVVTVEYTKTTD